MLRTTLAAGAVLAALTLAIGTEWGPLMDLDDTVARAAYDATHGHAGRVDAWSAISEYGAPDVLRALLLVAAAGLGLVRRYAMGLWLVALAFLEAWVAPTAKLVLERPRPAWEEPITTVGATSYPSGHATAAATVAVALVVVGLALTRTRPGRIAVITAGFVVIVAMAASRVFLGVHYLSDVAGGIALGTALAGGTAWLLDRWRPDAIR